MVSVPYWGSLYFNYGKLRLCGKDGKRFRPLLGFFIFQFEYVDVLEVPEKWFPSPIGVLYISILGLRQQPNDIAVSVPYWGSLYFN